MSTSIDPSSAGPRAAYVEECNEDSQDAIPGTRQSANVARKRSQPEVRRRARRDEASDSGYSSHTVATGDSSSQGSKRTTPRSSTFARLTRKVTGAGRKSAPSSPAAATAPVVGPPAA